MYVCVCVCAVAAAAIVLSSQTVVSEKEGLAVSNRRQTLKELLGQTTHYSERVRRGKLFVGFNASLTVFDNTKKMLSSSSLLLIQTKQTHTKKIVTSKQTSI